MEAVAKLRNYPTSPRKMRLVADQIRGMDVHIALVELQFSAKHISTPLRKLLLSAVSNWKQKNGTEETDGLFIKTIFVDQARSLKRMLPAPQGRAYRIQKRSNHVTLIVDSHHKAVKPSATTETPTEAKPSDDKKSVTSVSEKKQVTTTKTKKDNEQQTTKN